MILKHSNYKIQIEFIKRAEYGSLVKNANTNSKVIYKTRYIPIYLKLYLDFLPDCCVSRALFSFSPESKVIPTVHWKENVINVLTYNKFSIIICNDIDQKFSIYNLYFKIQFEFNYFNIKSTTCHLHWYDTNYFFFFIMLYIPAGYIHAYFPQR